MPKRTAQQSARLSSLGRRFGPNRAAAIHHAIQVGRAEARGPDIAQAYLSAWDAGKIRWQDIPAEYREAVS